MRYSIMHVEKEEDGIIDGSWIQDHHGDIDSAIEKKNTIQNANSSKLLDGSQMQFAVVEWLGNNGGPWYGIKKGLKKLA